MQLLVGKTFLALMNHQNASDKTTLVFNQGCVVTPAPTIICPIMVHGDKASIGLCIDHDSLVHFYLFTTPTPQLEFKKKVILFELQGGVMEGIGKNAKFVNKLVYKQMRTKIPSTTEIKKEDGARKRVPINYPLMFSTVYGEFGLQKASEKFYSEEHIPIGCVAKLEMFSKENYQNLHKIFG